MTWRRPLALWIALGCLGAACSPAGALCRKKQECAPDRNDTIDDESVGVCQVAFDARIAALRENSEAECHELADREIAFASCIGALDCEDFLEPDANGACADEREGLSEALDAAAGECASTD